MKKESVLAMITASALLALVAVWGCNYLAQYVHDQPDWSLALKSSVHGSIGALLGYFFAICFLCAANPK